MEINAHVIAPQELIATLYHLMNPLMCCPTKRGIEQKAVYVYEQKTYCAECLQKFAESMSDDKPSTDAAVAGDVISKIEHGRLDLQENTQ